MSTLLQSARIRKNKTSYAHCFFHLIICFLCHNTKKNIRIRRHGNRHGKRLCSRLPPCGHFKRAPGIFVWLKMLWKTCCKPCLCWCRLGCGSSWWRSCGRGWSWRRWRSSRLILCPPSSASRPSRCSCKTSVCANINCAKLWWVRTPLLHAQTTEAAAVSTFWVVYPSLNLMLTR